MRNFERREISLQQRVRMKRIRRLSTSGPHDVSGYYAQALSMCATPAEYFYACTQGRIKDSRNHRLIR